MLKEYLNESYKENKIGTLDECCQELCNILKDIGFTNINDMTFQRIKERMLDEQDGPIDELTFRAAEHDAPHVLAFFYSPFTLTTKPSRQAHSVKHKGFYMIGNAIGDLQNDYTLPVCNLNYNSETEEAWLTYWV